MERDQSLDEVISQMERDSGAERATSAVPPGMSAADIPAPSPSQASQTPTAEELLNEALQMADILRAEFHEQFLEMRREQQRLLDELRTLTEAMDREEKSKDRSAA